MARNVDPAIRALRHAAAETSEFLNSIANTSENLSKRSSEGLIGTLGGIVGGMTGYALSVGLGLQLPLIPIAFGAAFGIVAAILVWRAPQLFRERRRKWEEQAFADRMIFSQQQRKLLGPSPPQQLIEAIDLYPITGRLPGSEIAEERTTNQPSLEPPPTPRQLPPPNDEAPGEDRPRSPTDD